MDDILNRQIPHSTEAEQSVLGSMLIDSRCVAGVVGVLSPSDFYSDVNRGIYETILSMFNYSVPVDAVTVLDRMRERGVWSEDSPRYIIELANITPTAVNVMEYAAIVRDKSLLRALADAGADITGMAIDGEGGASNILEAAEKRIYALRRGRAVNGLEPVASVLISVFEQIQEASKNAGGIPGLSTGFSDIDNYIMGLNDTDLILIASRPGMGKTSIALNIALHVARESGKAVAVFSLEMSKEQLALRMLSSESYIDNKKLQTGRLSADEWKKLAAAVESINRARLLINDNPSITVSAINAQCRRVDELGLVVIDYLQLMQSATDKGSYSGETRTQVVADISRMMKIMAKELKVPVICMSQLSRANEGRADKRPLLSDLRESGAIEQDADVVIGLYRDDYYNEASDQPNVAELRILKNRRGNTGMIKLLWLPEYTAYTAIERRYSDEDEY
ncbi:MAG: replicative DNA helicase [Oscillospiraceae bacterium]|jgi:replicative DNA helicase|nr:replicative DNA helicase [Oscillospiraceae bacterium]